MNQGTYKIIRTTGEEEVIQSKPTIKVIEEAIVAKALDTVTLAGDAVMLVNDTGALDGLPMNAKATAIMRDRFGPGYPYSIYGDVVIVNDLDFGSEAA